MKNFLEIVAEDLLRKYGNNLSRVAVVFPNKRASLFLNEALARQSARPIWSPSYVTISDLFRQQSMLTVGDPIKLVCDLYKSYEQQMGNKETLDSFYGWGQLLINDFDDIDKNMAKASDVFRNLRDLHELDDLSYLTEEQVALIQRFFSNFSPEYNSELKRKFLELWCHLGDIYHDFRQRLRQQNLAYEGMLYREVAEQEQLYLRYDTYVFVGFNMMQQVEQMLCKRLMERGKAKFYWDFDYYYMKPHNEAGHYIREYLQYFPNELDNEDERIYSHLSDEKNIAYISAPTEDVQARFISQWLVEEGRFRDGKRTAIVMCNEQLLPIVIHCLPDEVDEVNITTGYPLSSTPVSSLVMLLMQSRRNAKVPKYILRRINRHPYHRFLDDEIILQQIDNQHDLLEWLKSIIKRIAQQTADEENPMQAEALFRMYTLLNRLATLHGNGDLDVDNVTLQRLVQQLVQTTSIPFHGEPAVGVQVMGVLETRNLDFDHVLILSCNEGNLPKGVNDASFIPYAIRKAYGLTTIDNKVAIFSYYFHAMLQRAKDVTICYNNSTEDGQRGEMSRFMLQLMVESGHSVRHYSLQSGQRKLLSLIPHGRKKDWETMEKLRGFQSLSPSAINVYLRCPVQFYFKYICGIEQPLENEDEKIDNRIFGNIFHKAAQIIYDKLGREIRPQDIEELLRHPEQLEQAVDQAIKEELFGIEGKKPFKMELNGLQLINREVIIRYLERLLGIDRQLAPFHIKGNEEKVYGSLLVTTSEGERSLRVGGTIDRLDQIADKATGEERIRVVDYKTGSRGLTRKVNDVAEIFDSANIREKHTDYYLQTMLYSLIVRNDEKHNAEKLPVSPALLFIQHTMAEDYDPTLTIGKERIDDIQDYAVVFREHIQQLVNEIFEPQIDFMPTEDKRTCTYCPYRQLCGL